ncbi:hypothetical protein FGIG_06793 [Fasciola gigantica]|uniref:Uncharacterized protein n=1 Tax=Fasciola gigantica TaxID=46835 RepID=A0A504YVK1_FASGI|nr:hypothetical protein FGIG_06793 [Fasciola gigantica]
MAPKSKPSSSKGLPSTYLTRKGELFLYSSTQEVQPWQSQVTLEELNFLADKRVNLSRAVEGEESRKQFLSKSLEVVGILKKNIEFPSSWLSPARETVPPIAVKQGLTMSEFLQLNRVRRGTSFQFYPTQKSNRRLRKKPK